MKFLCANYFPSSITHCSYIIIALYSSVYGHLGKIFRNASALSKGRSGLMVWGNAEGFEGMQKDSHPLSLFFEDQHEVQRVQSAGSMMCVVTSESNLFA